MVGLWPEQFASLSLSLSLFLFLLSFFFTHHNNYVLLPFHVEASSPFCSPSCRLIPENPSKSGSATGSGRNVGMIRAFQPDARSAVILYGSRGEAVVASTSMLKRCRARAAKTPACAAFPRWCRNRGRLFFREPFRGNEQLLKGVIVQPYAPRRAAEKMVMTGEDAPNFARLLHRGLPNLQIVQRHALAVQHAEDVMIGFAPGALPDRQKARCRQTTPLACARAGSRSAGCAPVCTASAPLRARFAPAGNNRVFIQQRGFHLASQALYVVDETRPPCPVQLVWKNWPRGWSTRS